MKSEHVTLPVYDLTCGGAGSVIVERSLARVPGVMHAYVNPATEMAYVTYDPALATADQLAAAITAAGYGPSAGGSSAPHSMRNTGQIDVRRLALSGGLWLTAVYALCILADVLFPGLVRMYVLWEMILPGVVWASGWTLLLGLVEAFLYGALGAWLLGAIYQALTPHALRSTALTDPPAPRRFT